MVVSSSSNSSAKAWKLALFLALAVYVGLVTWIVWIQFAFSADGFVSVIAEAIGTLTIPGLIAFAVSFRKKSKFAYLVALTVSAAVLVNSHWSGVLDGYDAREYKAEMAKATPQNFTEIPRNSKTRLGQTINAALIVTQKNNNEIVIMFQNMDDDRFKDILAAEALQSPARISSLSSLAIPKRQVASNADATLDSVFETTYQELETSMQGLSPRQRFTFLTGYKKSSEQLKGTFKQYAHTYVKVYDNLLGLYEVLRNNVGTYSVKWPASVVLYSNDAVAEFNSYYDGLTKDFKEMADIQSKLTTMQKNGVNQVIHSPDN